MADTAVTAQEITIAAPNGDAFVISAQDALSLPVASYARNGVVLLAGKRQKFNILTPEGTYVTFTGSLYLQRDAMNEHERGEIAKLTAERDGKAESKKAAELAEREKAVKAAFNMGQEAQLTSLKNISVLNEAARSIANLTR